MKNKSSHVRASARRRGDGDREAFSCGEKLAGMGGSGCGGHCEGMMCGREEVDAGRGGRVFGVSEQVGGENKDDQ